MSSVRNLHCDGRVTTAIGSSASSWKKLRPPDPITRRTGGKRQRLDQNGTVEGSVHNFARRAPFKVGLLVDDRNLGAAKIKRAMTELGNVIFSAAAGRQFGIRTSSR